MKFPERLTGITLKVLTVMFFINLREFSRNPCWLSVQCFATTAMTLHVLSIARQQLCKKMRGIVSVDQNQCIGCGYCSWVCPYGAPSMDTVNHVMSKCTFCAERTADGIEPYCVASCPANARIFGDMNDSESEVSKLVQSRNATAYKSEAGTNPNVFYI